jgi:hypothetical protein
MVSKVIRLNLRGKFTMRVLYAALALSVAFGAMAKDRRASPCADNMTPAEQLLAGELAHWRGISQLCRKSDGSNLNAAYWDPRLVAIPVNRKKLFSNSVKAQTEVFIQQNGGEKIALKCDNWMDDVRNDWDAADPTTDDPPRGPICFDEPTGLWRCKGTGEMDPLAGFDAIIDGR